jgi:hypothetical protein
MELLDACMLSEDEEIIFDDGNLGRNKKVVLTNKRLIFIQVKGRFKKTYIKEDEIRIEDVESAHYETGFSTIVIQLKNGEKDVIDLVRSDSIVDFYLGADSDILDVRLQATIDRWVNEINRLTGKVPKMIYCRYCGAKNKPTDIKCTNCGAPLS